MLHTIHLECIAEPLRCALWGMGGRKALVRGGMHCHVGIPWVCCAPVTGSVGATTLTSGCCCWRCCCCWVANEAHGHEEYLMFLMGGGDGAPPPRPPPSAYPDRQTQSAMYVQEQAEPKLRERTAVQQPARHRLWQECIICVDRMCHWACSPLRLWGGGPFEPCEI